MASAAKDSMSASSAATPLGRPRPEQDTTVAGRQ